MSNVVLDCRLVAARIDGLGRYITSLAEALAHAERPFELTLIVPEIIPREHPLASVTDWPVRAVRARPIRIGPSGQIASQRVCRALSCDLYHFPHFDLPLGAPTPSVVTIHDVTPIAFPDYFTGPVRAIKRWYFWVATFRAVRSAAAVIVPSQASADELIRRFSIPTSRLHLVHEGVPSMFRAARSPEDIRRMRDRHNLRGPYFLYVGVDRPHKNLVRLITAFAQVAPELPQDLVIVGQRTRARAHIERLVDRLGINDRIRWLGYVSDDDLRCLYGAADAFVLCSVFEGFGLPVVEAMASGTPVVVSEGTASAEVAGGACVLVDPLSITSIAKALFTLGTNPGLRRELSQRGLQRSDGFTWAAAAARTVEVYRSVLSYNASR